MWGDCHIHMILDGVDYRAAFDRHRDQPDDALIHARLADYRERGVAFLRDGGDRWGVGLRAKALAGEYGIDYRSPAFNICRAGHYGAFLGRTFADLSEYRALVAEVKALGGDFIKVMASGLMDFHQLGSLTDTPCDAALMRDLVEETGGLDARGTLAVCLCRMGTLNRLEGDLPAAHSHYEEALALLRALADETGTLESRSNLAYCCSLLGALCKQEGDLPGSRHWLEESAHLRRAIVEESGLIQARRRLARDLYQLGTLPGGDTEALYQAVELWNGLADIKGRTSPDWDERHTAILTLAQHPIAPNPPAGLESAGRRLFEESLALPPALIANPGTPKD